MNSNNRFFEFEDLSWFPHTIRESMTDTLRYIVTSTNLYQPVIPLILEGLQKTNSKQIIDLCSGGGGAIEQIQKNLNQLSADKINIILTDKFPNINAFKHLTEKSNGAISYSLASVDAASVPETLPGFRTIFSAFHHFNKPCAKSIIQNAVDEKSGIGIFDGGDKNVWVMLGMIPFHIILFFLFTPFFKPFRWSRIFFTYIIPVIPFCQISDGIVSITRLYKPNELLQIANEVDHIHYIWKAGKMRNKFGIHVSYLIGYPKT